MRGTPDKAKARGQTNVTIDSKRTESGEMKSKRWTSKKAEVTVVQSKEQTNREDFQDKAYSEEGSSY